jgi:hypothetical protein
MVALLLTHSLGFAKGIERVEGQLLNGLRYHILACPDQPSGELQGALLVSAGARHESSDSPQLAQYASFLVREASATRLADLAYQTWNEMGDSSSCCTSWDAPSLGAEAGLDHSLFRIGATADSGLSREEFLDILYSWASAAHIRPSEESWARFVQQWDVACFPLAYSYRWLEGTQRLLEGLLDGQDLKDHLPHKRPVQPLSADAVETFLEQHYVPQEMTLILAGGFDAGDVEAELIARFGTIAAAESAPKDLLVHLDPETLCPLHAELLRGESSTALLQGGVLLPETDIQGGLREQAYQGVVTMLAQSWLQQAMERYLPSWNELDFESSAFLPGWNLYALALEFDAESSCSIDALLQTVRAAHQGLVCASEVGEQGFDELLQEQREMLEEWQNEMAEMSPELEDLVEEQIAVLRGGISADAFALSPQEGMELLRQVLEEVSVADVRLALNELLTSQRRYVSLTVPSDLPEHELAQLQELLEQLED